MRRMAVVAIVAAFAASGCGMLEGGFSQKADVATRGVLSAVIVPQGPVLDGTLKSAVWNKCPPLVLGDVMSEQVGQLKTTARVLLDAKNLYIAFECAERDTASLKADVTGRDGTVWTDDSVEVFITGDPRAGFFHFIINPKGTFLDAVTKPNEDEDISWNGSAVVKTSIKEKQSWMVTMSLPLKELGAYVGKDQTWPMNLNRTKPGDANQYIESSWSSKGRSQYKDSDGWGKITRVQIFQRPDGVTRTATPPEK